jgi:hypothetical protein
VLVSLWLKASAICRNQRDHVYSVAGRKSEGKSQSELVALGTSLTAGKNSTQPSSYRPVSLLDAVGKLFEKILLIRVLREVNERGLLRDDQLVFRPRHSMTLHLIRRAERVSTNFDERRLTGAVFLNLAKSFDTVWTKGLLYKLTVLNSPSYLVKTIQSYLDCRTFPTSFQSATSTRHMICRGPGWTRLPCPEVCM